MIWMNCASGSDIKEVFFITIDGLLDYGKQCSSRSSEVLEIIKKSIMIVSTTSWFAVHGKRRGVLF